MRKHREVHRVPSPARHVVAHPLRQIVATIPERARDRLIARLARRGRLVVAPRGVVRRQRVEDESRHEREFALVRFRDRGPRSSPASAGASAETTPRKIAVAALSRVASKFHWRSTIEQLVDRAGPPRCACGEQERQQRLRVQRQRVRLDAREVVWREARCRRQAGSCGSGDQIRDPLRAVRLGPFEPEVVAVRRRRRTVVGGDDEVLGRIEGVRQLVERNPAGPLGVAGPAVGRPRAVAARADRDASGRVVADVAVDVGIDEVLRRHDELAQGRR